MFIDSHCHLNFPELASNIEQLIENMKQNGVTHALCVSVNFESLPQILEIAEQYENLYASVGVHPDYELEAEPSLDEIVKLSNHPKVIAIGETGLDYYRLSGDLEWQRERFRVHIRAAKQCGKPLIIHTRAAAQDTLRIMEEENAAEVGGVLHCFTETLSVAEAAIAMGFHISFSGILTFKSASAIKEVAQLIPIEKILIETDSPYLAPVPYRGKINQPSYVKYIAQELANLRSTSIEEIGRATSGNFKMLFKL